MMAALFLIYFISLILVFYKRRYYAFSLIVINLILCLFMLLHHATDVLQIHL